MILLVFKLTHDPLHIIYINTTLYLGLKLNSGCLSRKRLAYLTLVCARNFLQCASHLITYLGKKVPSHRYCSSLVEKSITSCHSHLQPRGYVHFSPVTNNTRITGNQVTISPHLVHTPASLISSSYTYLLRSTLKGFPVNPISPFDQDSSTFVSARATKLSICLQYLGHPAQIPPD